MTQNDSYHRSIKLEENNIQRFNRGNGLVCALQKCRQKLKVGDVIISVQKHNKTFHYHKECYDSLFFETHTEPKEIPI